MFGNFTEEARKILVNAKIEMQELKHPYVGSEHLMLAILKDKNNISKKLNSYKLDYQTFKEEIINIIGTGTQESNWFLYTPLLKRIMENAILDSKENNNGEVTIEHLFSSMLEEGEGVAIRIMLSMNIDIDELYNEFAHKLVNQGKHKKNKKLLLEELGIDLTRKAQNGEIDPVIGRETELKRILEILSRRTKNNPLLIGEPGVGKTAVVEELARMITNGEVPISLRNKRIISLDMATTVAGTKYRGEFEERVRKILKEIEENDDIILFIDEIHTLVGAGGAEGAIDASNIFKPALARNKLRCIGATTINEYKQFIEKDGALDRRFQRVFIETPSQETVKKILSELRTIYEQYHLVTISDEMLDLIIAMSQKYVYDRNQPDASIDILDEVCAKVSIQESKELKEYNQLNKELKHIIKCKNEAIINNDFIKASEYKVQENNYMDQINTLELKLHKKENKKEVTRQDIAEVIHMKTKIPVYEILNENRKMMEELEADLKKQIIGQNKAIEEVLKIAKRMKMGFKEENKCYSIMFTGASGTGKTALAKQFANHLVGENNTIKLDMSEYSEAHSVSKIIGAPPGYVGYADNQNLLEQIKNKPHSVLILDEVERSHPTIMNLFLQVLDEGKIKDSKGSEINFNNVTIIMTSNIGFHDTTIGFNKQSNEKVITKLKEQFSVPFINRIDNIVIFESLSQETIESIMKQKLENLKSRYQSKIKVIMKEEIKNEIKNEINYQEFGARKIEKVIKNQIENQIIDACIEGKNKIILETLKEKEKIN